MRFRLARFLVMAVALFAFATPSPAQVFTGRIDVTVVDTTGAVLPGVTVDISGPLNRSAVTDTSGEAHFLNLPPGQYAVAARLEGFSVYQNPNVPVVAGGGVPLRVALTVAGMASAVEVTAETPTIDPKRTRTSTNVTLEEMQNIPSSRDPWVVMQTVPGIIVDRVNVGGAESGQQSNYQAKGASGGQNTWNIDGIPITDMAATGASPSYYDFDMFQEMQVTTGGADVTNSTAGVHLNLVMKSGSNTPRGSFRGYFSNDGMQSNNLPDELKGTTLVGESGKGNRTEQYSDYGGEVGGPILRDKWWAWGSWGKTDVRIRTITDVLDRTELNNMGFKTQAQLNEPVRVGFTYFFGDKVKNGRGASAFRPEETTWDQSGPTSIYKGEVNWVASNNLFFTARGAYSDMGFELSPKGGLGDGKEPYRDVGRVWHNSFVYYKSDRPQHTALADGNWFRGRHEVKFGFSWRRAGVESISQWPGSKVYTIHLSSYPRNGLMLPIFTGDQVRNNVGRYVNAYIGDTISFNRATINLGLRFDRSTSTLLEATRPGSPLVPDVIPAMTTPEKENTHEFTTVTPRVGISYALDEDRRTLLRASYATFASQLGATDSGFVAGPTYYSYAYYLAIDANRDGITQANELITGALGSYGFDLADPSNVNSVNRIGEDLKSPLTHEVLLGLDRELMRNVGISGTFTWRRFNDLRWKPLIGVRRGDYEQTGTVSGSEPPIGSFNVPFFSPKAGVLPPGNGREELNHDGYHQRFMGFEFSATKRMSNRWMARIGFSTNDHREYFDNPDVAIGDPTPTPTSPKRDGGVVVTETGGSGKSDIFMVLPKYQFIANGMVQGPWGINLGANMVTRQGFGQPFYAETEVEDPSAGGLKNVLLVDDVGENRLPAVTSIDVRLEKAFRFNRVNVMFDLDVFNVTNTNTVLGRQFDLSATPGDTGFNKIIEIMNPRILRLGLRVNF